MEFKVLEETKKKLVFQLIGENHTFCNILKNELQKVKGVLIATYKVDHPLVGVPEFFIETKDVEPRVALKKALAAIKKQGTELQKEVSNL
ncbi:MAG: DNA-directed RNA polymerase subunit L [Nanoarchaeota archaeon]